MKTRIYHVVDGDDIRLVNAASAAQAVRHCAADRFRVSIAKTIDVATLVSQGVAVENARAEPDAE